MWRQMTRRGFVATVAAGLMARLAACGGDSLDASDSPGGSEGVAVSSSVLTSGQGSSRAAMLGAPWPTSTLAGNLAADYRPEATGDFYVHVNGDWLRTTELPEGRPYYMPLANDQAALVADRAIELLATVSDAEGEAGGSDLDEGNPESGLRSVRNVFALLCDREARDAAGVAGLDELIGRVDAVTSLDELTALLTTPASWRPSLLALSSAADPGEGRYLATIRFRGLGASRGLVSLVDDAGMATEVDRERARHVATLRASAYAGRADELFETSLAYLRELATRAQVSSEQTFAEGAHSTGAKRSRPAGANGSRLAGAKGPARVGRGELIGLVGGWPLQAELDAAGFGDVDEFMVEGGVEELVALGSTYDEEHVEGIKACLVTSLVHDACRWLTAEAADAVALVDAGGTYEKPAEDMPAGSNSTATSPAGDEPAGDAPAGDRPAGSEPAGDGGHKAGNEAEKPVDVAWRRSLFDLIYARQLSSAGDDALRCLWTPINRLYVGRYADEEARRQVRALCEDCVSAFRELLDASSWLGEEARDAALEKLDGLRIMALYPDTWDDCSALDIKSAQEGETLWSAYAKIRRFDLAFHRARVGLPHDASTLLPFLVTNCAYDETENSLLVFLGFVGEGSWRADMAIEEVYGGLATTVGHELSHAFDLRGSLFDQKGVAQDWWSADDRTEFRRRLDRVSAWFDERFVPLGETVDGYGQRVRDEMAADLGGLAVALRLARRRADFDYDRFFRSYARYWRCLVSEGYLRQRALVADSHPLDSIRVNLGLAQFDEFRATYGVGEGDLMYVDDPDRINVWGEP